MQFNSKIDIVKGIEVSDGLMGKTETPLVVHKDLPCRINWLRGTEKIMFDKQTSYRDAKIYYGADIRDITVEHKAVIEGKTYEIVSVQNPDNMNRYHVMEVRIIE